LENQARSVNIRPTYSRWNK